MNTARSFVLPAAAAVHFLKFTTVNCVYLSMFYLHRVSGLNIHALLQQGLINRSRQSQLLSPKANEVQAQ